MKKQFAKLAIRNIFKYRSRNLLTSVSIAIGTASIIIGLSITNGIIKQTVFGFTGTIVEDIMVFSEKTAIQVPELYKDIDDVMFFDLLFRNDEPILDNYKAIEKSIRDMEGITYVTKKVQFNGTVFSEESLVNSMIMGMEPEGIRRKRNLKMETGRYLTEDDRLSLIVSEKIANRLQVEVGDTLAIVVNMPNGGTNARDFKITGVFSIVTGLEFVNHIIYISLWDAQELMGITDDQIYNLGVYLDDVEAVDHYEAAIAAKMATENRPCRIFSWKKVIKGILAQYYFIKYVVFIFTIVLLFIVCVGVINSVYLSVSERIREIGTMMALGAKRKTIISLFMLEGFILSLFSAIYGSLFGIGVSLFFEKVGVEAPTVGAANVFGGKNLYADLSYSTVMFSLIFVVVITLIGISYPIFKSSSMEPTDALRHV